MTSPIAAAALAALLMTPIAALAQKPASVAEVVTETFTIEAIDQGARLVTLKDKTGQVQEIVCGPEVQRFDQLKVGDRVTFRYHESLVSALHKVAPGTPARPPVSAAVTRTPGSRPGGTVSQQMTVVVTIVAIDAKVPSVTIKAEDGSQLSFKVENPKFIEGYKAGDRVEMTYTQALAVSVIPAK